MFFEAVVVLMAQNSQLGCVIEHESQRRFRTEIVTRRLMRYLILKERCLPLSLIWVDGHRLSEWWDTMPKLNCLTLRLDVRGTTASVVCCALPYL